MSALPKGKRNVQEGIFTLGSLLETIKVYRKNGLAIIKELTNKFANLPKGRFSDL